MVKEDSTLEQTDVEVKDIEIPLSNPISEVKSPSKAKAPDPIQNESESHVALNAPKSSGEKFEPTPVSRKIIILLCGAI
ncbi:MAG: hypothetical protein MJE68_09380 [Proteobacteria bacterium]|nr:hypothetical protein [Pseudomonadota bacterium]